MVKSEKGKVLMSGSSSEIMADIIIAIEVLQEALTEQISERKAHNFVAISLIECINDLEK